MAKDVKTRYVVEGKDRTKAALTSVRNNLSGVDKVVTGMSGNLAGVLGVGGLGYMVSRAVKQTAASFDELAKASKHIGVLTDELDALRYAANLSGIGDGELTAAIRRLPAAAYDASRGVALMEDAFGRLGVEVLDQNGNIKDITTLLLEMSSGLDDVESGTERAAIAAKILGRSGQAFITMLEGGPEQLRAMLAEAHALGTRTAELTATGEDYQDAQLRLNRALRATSDVVWGQTLPALSQLAETIANEVVTATTGLDKEFRGFVGLLRTLPAQTALDEIKARAEETEAALAANEARMRELGRRGRGFASLSDKWEYNRLANESETLRKESAALASEQERLQKRLDLLRESQNRHTTSTLEAAEAARLKAERERAVAAIITATLSPQERLTGELRKLNTIYEQGHVSESTYLKRKQQILAAMLKLDPEYQRVNTLLEEGRQLTEQYLTPLEKYNQGAARLAELLREDAISSETYQRALAALRQEMKEAADNQEDLGQTATVTGAVLESALTTAANGVGSALTDMVDQGERELNRLEQLAVDTSRAVLNALWRTGLVEPLAAAAQGIISGGNTNTPPAGSVPEPVPAGPVAGPQLSSQGATAPQVQITIQAMDGPSVVKALHDNKDAVVGLVQQAYNRTGRRGPLG